MSDNKMSFEAAMEALEASVGRLESGTLSLDESIAEFEGCVKLIRLCDEKLTNAKQKVRILTENTDGVVTDKAFVPEDEDET